MSALEDVLSGARRFALICADNAQVLPLLPNRSVAHVITDPPYSEHVHGKQRRVMSGSGGRPAADGARRGNVITKALGFDALTREQMVFCADRFADIARRWVLVFSDAEGAADWRSELVVAGLRHIRVQAWVKVAGQPQLSGDRPAVGFEAIETAHGTGERCRWNGGGLPGVYAYQIATDRNGTGDRVHTTQKPLDLMLRLVELFTDPDDIVLDPFAGSGTTGVACLRLGRRFIGIERSEEYAALATARLEAEAQGLTLRDARAGQLPMFGGGR